MNALCEALADGVFTDLVAQAVWAIGVGVAGAFYVGFVKDRAKFGGQWLRAEIRWASDWAKDNLIGTPAQDVHSVGKIALAWDAGRARKTYWGLGSWTLKRGTESLSKLCVEFHTFEIAKVRKRWFSLPRHVLRSCRLSSEFRVEQAGFEYPTQFANYRVRFTSSSADRLEGDVELVNVDSARVVGKFHATRE